MIVNSRIAITACPDREVDAKKTAQQFNFPYVNNFDSTVLDYDYLLSYASERMELHTKNSKTRPFYLDFTSGKTLYRSQHASLRKELLARAIGIKPSENPTIVDATAGLGRDSFILAALGFNLFMLERSVVLFLLLTDALTHASKHHICGPIVKRMRLIHANTNAWLKQSVIKPDIIYLDPMFPPKQKSAAVKKEIAFLQQLLGSDESESERLFELALTCARLRVVVKRPRLATNICKRAPDYSLQGKNTRFDIYLPKPNHK